MLDYTCYQTGLSDNECCCQWLILPVGIPEGIDVKDSTLFLSGEVRHVLMMTSLHRGILVALKPTDEGRIGTGRNTQENERV
jgi:hypothetical protein